jgi:hypothetical protein
MSPLEFHYACNGYMNKYYKGLEQTRLIAYTVSSTVKTKHRIPPITKWMPLPSDKQITKISDTRALEIFKKYMKDA